MPKRKKLSFKKDTRAYNKRSEIAEAIHREHPGMSDEQKFRIATAATKKTLRRKRS